VIGKGQAQVLPIVIIGIILSVPLQEKMTIRMKLSHHILNAERKCQNQTEDSEIYIHYVGVTINHSCMVL
jgi:hypothetical protein